jgi:DNA processing protein
MYKDTVMMSTLHMAGCTSRDFQKLREVWKTELQIYEDITLGSWDKYTDWMTHERREKIRYKLKSIIPRDIADSLDKHGISVVLWWTDQYPVRLQRLERFPYILYIRGTLRHTELSLAIVWSRKSTTYGEHILDNIIPSLVSTWAAIISGWAYGIDSIAHEKTLSYGWYAVCVFWNSLDYYYPERNYRLFEKIIEAWGWLVSPFALWTMAESYLFPQRNEIVAGLSDGVIIPEAWEKSGTLITAHLALEQWKDVFCFPWDIFRSTSLGTNSLIQKWEAKCVHNAAAILEEFFEQKADIPKKEKEFATKEENDIYKCINLGYDNAEDIANFSDYTVDSVLQTLSLLEIGWHIQVSREGKYISS